MNTLEVHKKLQGGEEWYSASTVLYTLRDQIMHFQLTWSFSQHLRCGQITSSECSATISNWFGFLYNGGFWSDVFPHNLPDPRLTPWLSVQKTNHKEGGWTAPFWQLSSPSAKLTSLVLLQKSLSFLSPTDITPVLCLLCTHCFQSFKKWCQIGREGFRLPNGFLELQSDQTFKNMGWNQVDL